MPERNLSVNAHFRQLAAAHTPAHRFAGQSAADFEQWQSTLLPKVRHTLGAMPAQVPLNAECIAEWRDDGLIKQKIVFDVEQGLSATAYIFRPADKTGALPAILCCHGHGPHAKAGIMGLVDDPAVREQAYGLHMAKAGFVTLALDWRGFGERDDRKKPNNNDMFGHRDICNIQFNRAAMFGRTMLGCNIHDAQRALDHLCAQDYVDQNRIGVMGLSLGGTMTTWMSLCEPRIKAADILCYSDRFEDFAIRDANFCGSQYTPGLYALCDVPDLQGLIAPRPLLVEIGAQDNCFRVESAMSCYREVEKIYAAAGAADKLELDLFEGGHGWGANKSVPFFNAALGA